MSSYTSSISHEKKHHYKKRHEYHVMVDNLKVAVPAHTYHMYRKYAHEMILAEVANNGGKRFEKEEYKKHMEGLMHNFVKCNVGQHLRLEHDHEKLKEIQALIGSVKSGNGITGMAAKLEHEIPGGSALVSDAEHVAGLVPGGNTVLKVAHLFSKL